MTDMNRALRQQRSTRRLTEAMSRVLARSAGHVGHWGPGDPAFEREYARFREEQAAEREQAKASPYGGLGGGARGMPPEPPSVESTLRALVDERRGRIAESAAAYEQDRRWRAINTRPEEGSN